MCEAKIWVHCKERLLLLLNIIKGIKLRDLYDLKWLVVADVWSDESAMKKLLLLLLVLVILIYLW